MGQLNRVQVVNIGGLDGNATLGGQRLEPYPSGQVTYQAPQSQDMVCT
jgi:hypothetical protein